MVNNKKKRNNNRNNKKNKLKKAESSRNDVSENDEQEQHEEQEETEYELNESMSTKRSHDDDNSDAEETPRKKKKKKQLVPTEGPDKKGKKSIRQMKREKFAERQAEAQAEAKSQLKSQCLNYLSQWKHDKQNWKFMKAKQVWLFKNKFSSNLIPDASWPLFLEYFVSAMGNIRNMLLEDANKIIKQMDEWTETQSGKNQEEEEENEDAETPLESKKPDDTSYKRARDLIQCLQE